MTTKPKVQKYRIRRAPRTTGGASKTVSNAKTPVDTPNTSDQAPQEPQKNAANATPNVMAQGGDDRLFDNAGQDDGFGDAPYPGSAAATHKAKAERPKGGVASTIKAANSAPERKRNKADTTENGEAQDETSADGDIPVDEAIDAIRREGLTGRQLRMARRVAAKHGLRPPPISTPCVCCATRELIRSRSPLCLTLWRRKMARRRRLARRTRGTGIAKNHGETHSSARGHS